MLVDLPSATTTFQGIGSWSYVLIDELWPVTYLIIGIAVGAIVVSALINFFTIGLRRLLMGNKED